ncbi:HPP family protein [Flavobacterium sp. AG291]|uniref:HPP family protein n=1 Tax=Flavobacterium sp. AG291 TaxID=2184000 RepID=UPI000E0A319A|nr:HPP family protein [Flavobacterium sp. AG291]RDI05755.1 HPP family protein [Flavobacterium sp. AG291]
MPLQKIKRSYRKTRYVVYKETLVNFKEHLWAFIGAFVGMGILSWLQYEAFPQQDYVFLIGSFGASCVLIYGVIQSPLAQPRNLIGGHLLSAVIGVSLQKLMPEMVWLSAPLAVALSIVAMQMTKTLHPPGGATALIAVTGSPQIKTLGYEYVLNPVLSGAMILLIIALIFNNIPHNRQYPSAPAVIKFKKFRKALKKSVKV